MNSMVRYFSIFLGAMILSLASYSFASTGTETESPPTFHDPTGNIDASNPCIDSKGYKVADSDTCKNGVPKKKTKNKDSSNNGNGGNGGNGGQQGGQQGGQPANNQQNQQADQQPAPQKSSSGSSSGSCADTSSDPKGKKAANPVPGSDPNNNDQAGKGLKQACEGIKSAIEQQLEGAHRQGQTVGMQNDNYEALKAGYDEYIKNREACLTNHADAATMCLEGTSPDLANGAAGVNGVLSGLGQNASENCGKANNAMDLAKGALTAFNGSCGAAKGQCNSSCSKAVSGLDKLIAKANTTRPTCDGTNPACAAVLQQYMSGLEAAKADAQQEKKSSEMTSMAGKQKLCQQKYAQQMASALQGIMSMLAGMMQSNKCEEETAGTPEEQALGAISDKCIIAENANLPECICARNPRTVGCANSFEKSDLSNSAQISTGATDGANVDPTPDLGTTDMGSGLQHAPLSADNGSGGVGAPMGGNAGLGNSTVGSGAGTGAGGDGRKGLNANILAGTTGGGNGGGGWGSGGSGDKYRAYLPGGAKDPARSVAGQQAWTKEVTGQGGKSNWEKVKERYRDNKSTLLNN